MNPGADAGLDKPADAPRERTDGHRPLLAMDVMHEQDGARRPSHCGEEGDPVLDVDDHVGTLDKGSRETVAVDGKPVATSDVVDAVVSFARRTSGISSSGNGHGMVAIGKAPTQVTQSALASPGLRMPLVTPTQEENPQSADLR